MTTYAIQTAFPTFHDLDGAPLNAGFIYIGAPNLDPVSNPISVYFDEALTVPAAQPIRTLNGRASNSGTPAQLYTDAIEYSMTVQDKTESLVYSALTGATSTAISSDVTSIFETFAALEAASMSVGHRAETTGYHAAGDGGAGKYLVAAAGTIDLGNPQLANGNVAVLQVGETVYAQQFGTQGLDSTVDTQAFIDAVAFSRAKVIFLALQGGTVCIAGEITLPDGVRLRGGTIKYDPPGATQTTLRLANNTYFEYVSINSNGNDYGLQETAQTGGTFGLKYSKLYRVIITGSAVTDFFFEKFHFVWEMTHCFAYSDCSSYGIVIVQDSNTPTPDIRLTGCYVKNPTRGYKLWYGSFTMDGCSADSTIDPIHTNNTLLNCVNCGFEEATGTITIGSSMATFDKCTFTTTTGEFTDDGGRVFINVAGGTYPGSVELKGCIAVNRSPNVMALVRIRYSGSGIIPRALVHSDIGKSLLSGTGVTDFPNFYYSSSGNPSVALAQRTVYGNTRNVVTFSGIDTVGNSAFPIYASSRAGTDFQMHIMPSEGMIRYLSWREFGADTAGAPTTIQLVVYEKDGTERSRGTAFAISGADPGDPQRYGSTILDVDVFVEDYIELEVSVAGERQDTGIMATLTIDS